jgi:hypothetical protein
MAIGVFLASNQMIKFIQNSLVVYEIFMYI